MSAVQRLLVTHFGRGRASHSSPQQCVCAAELAEKPGAELTSKNAAGDPLQESKPQSKAGKGALGKASPKKRLQRLSSKLFKRVGGKRERRSTSGGSGDTASKASDDGKDEQPVFATLVKPAVAFTSDEDRSRIVDAGRDPVATLEALREALPERLHAKKWRVVYDFERHGASLGELYSRAAKVDEAHGGESLLMVKTAQGRTFGCFCTERWTPSRVGEYYGSGETLLFSLNADGSVSKHGWAGGSQFIQTSGPSHVAVGGGADALGWAFCITEDLFSGSASPSPAFGLEQPLVPEGSFQIAEVELLVFENPSLLGRSSNTTARRSSLFSDDNVAGLY